MKTIIRSWFCLSLTGSLICLSAVPEQDRDFTKLSLTYGYSMILNGFTDQRFIGADKQDYIKSANHNTIFELTKAFSTNSPFLNNMIGKI